MLLINTPAYRFDRNLALTQAGFDWVDNAHLRPFLFPPIPRTSVLIGKAPEGWPDRTGPGRARQDALLSPEGRS